VPASLGSRLLHLREEKKWSQDDLAERIGVGTKSAGHYENDIRYPRHEALVEISKLLHVTVGHLYAETRPLFDEARRKSQRAS
jgi:transcriptional regulator with XRE-family HTH domain